MARAPTERPLTEQIATLTRIHNQVSVSVHLRRQTRISVMTKLQEAIALLQQELSR